MHNQGFASAGARTAQLHVNPHAALGPDARQHAVRGFREPGHGPVAIGTFHTASLLRACREREQQIKLSVVVQNGSGERRSRTREDLEVAPAWLVVAIERPKAPGQIALASDGFLPERSAA